MTAPDEDTISHTSCWSCGRPTTTNDYCYGCKEHVCLRCVECYGHDFLGDHGRSPVRLVDLKKD